jgi:hypothetical protein
MSFGEDSFHCFLLLQILFNFAKCFCEKFGIVAQLRFFEFFKNGGKSAIFSKNSKESEKKISAL